MEEKMPNQIKFSYSCADNGILQLSHSDGDRQHSIVEASKGNRKEEE